MVVGGCLQWWEDARSGGGRMPAGAERQGLIPTRCGGRSECASSKVLIPLSTAPGIQVMPSQRCGIFCAITPFVAAPYPSFLLVVSSFFPGLQELLALAHFHCFHAQIGSGKYCRL